jgi:hypothetical protein
MIDFRINHFNPKQIPVANKDPQKQTKLKPRSDASQQIATKKDSIQLALSPEARQSVQNPKKTNSSSAPNHNNQNDKIKNNSKSTDSPKNSRTITHVNHGAQSKISAYQKFLNPPRTGQFINKRA